MKNRGRPSALWAIAGLLTVASGIVLFLRADRPSGRRRGKETTAGGARLVAAPALGEPRGAAARLDEVDAFRIPSICGIAGSVEDETGRAVPQAEVTARLRRGGPAPPSDPISVRCGENGRFEIAALRCGRYFVTGTAGDQVTIQPTRVRVSEEDPRANLRLVLSRSGFRISGLVSERGGGSIGMARLRASQIPGGSVFSGRSDEQGRYAIRVPAGTYWLEADADSYATSSRRVVVSRDQTVNVDLDPAGTIRGRVTLASTGEPVEGATVRGRAGRRRWSRDALATTESDGSFELTGLLPGDYGVEAILGRLRGRAPNRVAVNVAGYVAGVEIRVRPGLAIRGRVLTESEGPISGAIVRWEARGGAGAEAESRPDGTYALFGMAPGRGRVVAQHDRYASGSEEVIVSDQDIDDVDIVLMLGVTVRGMVKTQAGQGVPGAIVSGMPDRNGFRRMHRQGGARDFSDADGSYRLEGLAAQDLVIRAQHPGVGFASHALQAPQAGREYEVNLTIENGASISGQVAWTDGEPAVAATVHALNREAGPFGAVEAETDASGSYTLSGMEPREYLVWSLRPESDSPMPFPSAAAPRREVALEEGACLTGIDFVLERADQEIAGQVVDEAGGPVADALVTAELEHRGFRPGPPRSAGNPSTRTSSDGSFVVTGLTSGTYRITAELPGFPSASASGVEAGATGVVVTVPPGAVLAGAVVTDHGEPVTHYELRTLPARQSAGWVRWRGDDALVVEESSGAFEVRGLAAGVYRMVAATAGGAVGEIPSVQVAAGEREDGLRIVMANGATLVATLTAYPSGAPVAGVAAFLDTDAGPVPIVADQDGRLRAEGLATGEALLFVRPSSGSFVFDHFSIVLIEGENQKDLRLLESAALLQGAGAPALGVEARGERLEVVVMDPAAVANVESGDLLVGIDGVATAGFGVRGARALLAGPVGTQVSVSLVGADGTSYTATVDRRETPDLGPL